MDAKPATPGESEEDQRWHTLMDRLAYHRCREEFDEALEVGAEAVEAAASYGRGLYAMYLIENLVVEAVEDLAPDETLSILTSALEHLDELRSVSIATEHSVIDFLRAKTEWQIAIIRGTTAEEGSSKDLQRTESALRTKMVRLGNAWAKQVLTKEGQFAKTPPWMRPFAEHCAMALLRLRELHRHDPEILERPTELVRVFQEEVSFALSATYESYEDAMTAGLSTPEEQEAFRKDYRNRQTEWRQRPFARDVEQFFEACWAGDIDEPEQEIIRQRVNEAYGRAILEVIPSFVAYMRARKPEAKSRATVRLVAAIVEAAYKPVLQSLLDLSRAALGKPRSTELMSVGTLVDTAASLWSRHAPGLVPAANRSWVIVRNAVAHHQVEVTVDGEVTLWGSQNKDPSKMLGPLGLEAVEAMLTEMIELCMTLMLGFSMLLHPDTPHLGRPKNENDAVLARLAQGAQAPPSA